MRLLFGNYEPDKPPFLSDGLQTASNVYKSAIGWRPVGQFTPLTTALASKPLGAGTFTSPAGVTTIISGTSDKLYRGSATGWTQIGTGYATGATGRWRFAQFGGLAIATNGVDPMVKIDLDTYAVANLGGSPPKAKMLTVVKDFLVGGVIDGVVNMVQWSGINNAEAWTVGVEQCDYQIIPSGGEVTGLLGGEFGVILQRGRVSRMTYVGDNLVFQFDEISNNVGCVSPHSVIQAGQLGFWLSDSGFMMWDGATIKPIGQERVDRTFAVDYTNSDWTEMSTSVDLRNSLVAWAMADKILVYNWVLDSWSVINQASSIIFSGFSRTWTLEEIGTIYPSLETVPLSLDDPYWKGGNPLFYVFDTTFKLGTLSGSTMAGTITTGDVELVPGRDARLSMARLLSDATSGVTISIGSRARLGDALAENDYSGLTSSGDVPVRESGRYMRFTQTIAAGTDWTYSQGLDLVPHRGARR
jgi:hypothetical protein